MLSKKVEQEKFLEEKQAARKARKSAKESISQMAKKQSVDMTAQMGAVSVAMQYLDIDDDDEWMLGTYLMPKQLTVKTAGRRLCSGMVNPYVFRYFITVANAMLKIGKNNYLAIADTLLEGVFHFPLACQAHFKTGMGDQVYEYEFRVIEKGAKTIIDQLSALFKDSHECGCERLISEGFIEKVSPHLFCGRYWNTNIQALLATITTDNKALDFTSP